MFYNRDARWRCYKTFFLFDGVEYSHPSREFVNGRLAGAKLYNYLASLAVMKKKFYNRDTRWRCYKTFFRFDGVEYSHASREFVNGRLTRNKRSSLFGHFGSDEEKVL
jgi:hypothetical protein